jgi:thiamine biosynthesis lipoprotein
MLCATNVFRVFQLAALGLVILVAVAACGGRRVAPSQEEAGKTGAVASAAPGPDVAKRPVVPGVHARSYHVMGTEAVFTAWTDDVDKAELAFTAAYEEIRRIEELMTDWEHPGQPPSDVVRINAAAGKAPVHVSDETMQVINASLDMSRRSDGAFDITYAAMRGLWKFDEDLEKKIPPAAEIERKRQLINFRDVQVDDKKQTVRLRRAGMKLGLGGIAKGYAVDRCAEVLRRHGLQNFMVQAGGDLFVSGQKGNAPWMVGVRDPRGGPRAIIAKMAIKDHAFSTAGDYERAFLLDGRRYHHIIDPKTGYPATASRGVTIFAPTAFLADALDDAVFILGPERGMALIEAYPNCSAMIVDAANQVWVSKSLEGRLERTGPPTEGP